MWQRRQTATGGWLARWLLLACTLVGLAAMHSLGHDGGAHATAMTAEARHATAMTAEARHTTATTAAAPHTTAMTVALDPARQCVGDGCAHLSGMPGGGHDMAGWSVCLAIVSGFAVLLLLAAALVAVSRDDPAGVLPVGGGAGPRAPPDLRPVGLTLAKVSILRT